jgi:hypothetical protein
MPLNEISDVQQVRAGRLKLIGNEREAELL